MAIPTKIKNLANDVRTKIYGRDVRESIAKGMEESGDIADNARQTSIDAVDRVSIYKSQFDQSILDGDQPAEVQALRVDSLTGETYTTAADRFEENHRDFKGAINVLDFRNINEISLLEFGSYAVGDDWTQALKEAFKRISKGVLKIPPGDYKITEPIPIKSGITLEGVHSAFNTDGGVAKFNLASGISAFVAEEGFSGRHNIVARNLAFTGDGTQKVFDFNFRGLITECTFHRIKTPIDNKSAYYSHYIHNQFEYCGYAIKMVHANGVSIERNRFNGCEYGVYSQNENGGLGGMALSIKHNGLNISDNSKAGFKVGSALVDIEGNYFEGYGTPSDQACMIELSYPGTLAPFRIIGNYFGSHGRVKTGIKLDYPGLKERKVDGLIEGNTFYRLYDDVVFTENNDIFGIEIKGNNSLAPVDQGDASRDVRIVNQRPDRKTKPYAYSTFAPNIDISGDTSKDIDLGGGSIVIDTAGGIGNPKLANKAGYRPRESGIYRIDVDLTLRSDSQNYPGVSIYLLKSGSVYKTLRESVYYEVASGQTFKSVKLTCLVELNAGNPINLKGAYGHVISSGSFTIEKID